MATVVTVGNVRITAEELAPVATPAVEVREVVVFREFHQGDPVWSGPVASQTERGKNYHVAIFQNAVYCSCPDFFFEGTLKNDRFYRCKHLATAMGIRGAV